MVLVEAVKPFSLHSLSQKHKKSLIFTQTLSNVTTL
ncbi:hypothetical protein JOC54_004059 [Alkalihalobacillus xiaoxiensis]|uniref:Uncharacterized protein n=1 Tax=Shouchella xiaoxiensis TaxID=766895 RepID=A0ABS2SZY1_9BACI|nr:hypothetical protein [Shouchella xiaoxiensis]